MLYFLDIIPGIIAVCNGYMHILPTIRLVIYIFTSFASILCIFERKIGDIWRKRVIPIIYLKYVLRSYAIKYVELRAYTIYIGYPI